MAQQTRRQDDQLTRRIVRYLAAQRGVPVDARAIMRGVGIDRDQRLYEALRVLSQREQVERCKSARLHRWVYRTPSDDPWPTEHAWREVVSADAELPTEHSDTRERRVRTRFPDDRQSLSDRYVPLTPLDALRIERWSRREVSR